MNRFLTGKFRLLYLLALIQLLGGPLVLFQVSVFCKLTLREAPQVGVAKAALLALHAEDFQQVVANPALAVRDASKGAAPGKAPVPDVEKAKDPGIPWLKPALNPDPVATWCAIGGWERVWKPAQAQPPPGPPPRLG
ncbi:MAG: hypothetical protein V4640_03320 [Verrucomicrobiota bacterium]